MTDREEALRLSGTTTTEAACDFFVRMGVGAYAITGGPDPIHYYSRGTLFSPCRGTLPVSEEIGTRLARGLAGNGDTTGCGDNFAGGVLAGLALQTHSQRAQPDLVSACALGISCGGFACFYLGGTFHETRPGEKRTAIEPIYECYRAQLDGVPITPFERLF
jgi:sugar/nucleoside kinase (ribokinase family)